MSGRPQPVDLDKLERSLKSFLKRHRAQFDRVGKRQSQMLEVGALAACAEHYRAAGYDVTPANLMKDGSFRVLISANGLPWNFSRFDVTDADGQLVCEIHANLKTGSAYQKDDGVFVVDVGVVRPGAVPQERVDGWRSIPNEGLVTFIEVKALVVYPMLVAQFIGITHELAPQFVLPGRRVPLRFRENGHFHPTLACLGNVAGITKGVVDHLPARKIWVNVVDSFGVRLGLTLNPPEGESLPELPWDGTFVLAVRRADTDELGASANREDDDIPF